MSRAGGPPSEQPAASAGTTHANAAGTQAAKAAAPLPAAPDAAAPPDAAAANTQPTPPDTTERLEEMEKNWVGILERVTAHVDAAEEKLQRQLVEEARQGWQPPPYHASGPNVVPRTSAASVALSWWQHSDRCLNTAVAREEDLKTTQLYQTKMRGALERIKSEQQAAMAAGAAAAAGGQRAAAAGGQDAEGGASPSASPGASTAGPVLTRSEIAKRKWLMGGLAAAAARMDALVDRITAMSAQAQEVRDVAKKTAGDKLAAYLTAYLRRWRQRSGGGGCRRAGRRRRWRCLRVAALAWVPARWQAWAHSR